MNILPLESYVYCGSGIETAIEQIRFTEILNPMFTAEAVLRREVTLIDFFVY